MNSRQALKHYNLRPENQNLCHDNFDILNHYAAVHSYSRFKSDIKGNKELNLSESCHATTIKCLNQTQVESTIALISRQTDITYGEEANTLLASILNERVDKEIKNYFKSNYAILFFAARTLINDGNQENISTKWHCDAGPTNFINVMCYLEDDSEHGSSTLLMDEITTKKLKEIGYVYCSKDDRKEEISDLLDHYQLSSEVTRYAFKAGEAIVFCPTKLIHRAQTPKEGKKRTTIDICLIPSPVPWREAIKLGFTPGNEKTRFHEQATNLLKRTCSDYAGIINRYTPNLMQSKKECIHIPADGKITSLESLKLHLNSIFTNKQYADELYKNFSGSVFFKNSPTISSLIIALKNSFKNELDWNLHFNTSNLKNLEDLLAYERNYTDSLNAYNENGDISADKIFWPIPNHNSRPENKYHMLPFAHTNKIMTKSTPIGSAGSYFAVEIAEVLQEQGYNYVISELGDNPGTEAIIDGYNVNSANFWTLFNTPSLKQLAEKAFGIRKFQKLLVNHSPTIYMDPYRHQVFFNSTQSYLTDYPKHINAIKQVLLESKVFIFTVGLNECWELPDKTVISRNPISGLHHLIKHKVLTVEENVKNIIEFFDIVKTRNPDFKLILTLSPVPLLATARSNSHHIIEANTHSKSVLRVAIDQVVNEFEDIYYLPSYELITECIESPWQDDRCHVKKEAVKKVINMFSEIFVDA